MAVAKSVQMLLGDPRDVFSASETGTLLYQDGAAESATSLAWFDRDGRQQSLLGEMGTARGLFISPNGLSAALGIADAESRVSLWRLSLSSMERNRLTFETNADDVSSFLAWAPDSRHSAYGAKRDGKIIIARTSAVGGQSEPLFDVPAEHTQGGMPRVTAWTDDASVVLYASQTTGGIYRLPLASGAPGAALSATKLLRDIINTQQDRPSAHDARWHESSGRFPSRSCPCCPRAIAAAALRAVW